MRPVKITIGNIPLQNGSSFVVPYPAYASDRVAGKNYPIYEFPTFNMTVEGTLKNGVSRSKDFEVMRFGVKQSTKSSRPIIAGMFNDYVYTVKRWKHDYLSASEIAEEQGAWVLYKTFYIHDGPDHPRDKKMHAFGLIGCVGVCGLNGFSNLNKFIIELAGPTATTYREQLEQIARKGILKVHIKGIRKPSVGKSKTHRVGGPPVQLRR